MEPILQAQLSQDSTRGPAKAIPQATLPPSPARRVSGGPEEKKTEEVKVVRRWETWVAKLKGSPLKELGATESTTGQQSADQRSNQDKIAQFATQRSGVVARGFFDRAINVFSSASVAAGNAISYAAEHPVQALAVGAVGVGVVIGAASFTAASVTLGLGVLAYNSGALQFLGGPPGFFGALSAARKEKDPEKIAERWENVGREGFNTSLSLVGAIVSSGQLVKNVVLQGLSLLSRFDSSIIKSEGLGTSGTGGMLESAVEAMVAKEDTLKAQAQQAIVETVAKPLVDAAMVVFNQRPSEQENSVALRKEARALFITTAREYVESLSVANEGRRGELEASLRTIERSGPNNDQINLFGDIIGQFHNAWNLKHRRPSLSNEQLNIIKIETLTETRRRAGQN